MRFEHHYVYFRPLQTEIEIVRVLHVAMDADAEL
jgi:plasmid stabilization system protein ParE